MKEDSLYFSVFLKVVYNCIWKMTHLCIKLRKLKTFLIMHFWEKNGKLLFNGLACLQNSSTIFLI